MTSTSRAPRVQRALLSGAIDYAGLFPPASLSMGDAVRNYLEYAVGPEAWALGRFVVPAARLPEMERAVSALSAVPEGMQWRLSALAGAVPSEEARTLADLPGRAGPLWSVDAVESKAGSASELRALAALSRQSWTLYVELPLGDAVESLAAAVGEIGACVKLRTGGVTESAIPAAEQVAGALVACARAGVPCKATAGLHHPIRATYPLTYALDAPRGTMFGYLNLFLAALVARRTWDAAAVALALDERDVDSLALAEDGITWRGERYTLDEIDVMRADFCHGFGSCSFREPMDEFPREAARGAAR